MTRTTQLVATALALLLVTSAFGSIGAATNTNNDNEKQPPAPTGDGDSTVGDNETTDSDGATDSPPNNNRTADLIATLDRLIEFLTNLRDRLAGTDGDNGDTGDGGDGDMNGTPTAVPTEIPDTGTETPGTDTETPSETATETPVGTTGTPGTPTDTPEETTATTTDAPETTDEVPTETTGTPTDSPPDTPNNTTTEAPTDAPNTTTATGTPPETTTEAPTETTTQAPTATPTPPENASVVFDDQTSSGQQVTVAEAALPEAGEVRVTDAGGNVLGTTELPAGENTDVQVQLDPPLARNQTLTADLFDSQGNALRNASGETATDTAEVTVPVVGATRAPDLTDVSDFRTGETTDGRAATLADFTFDQPVDVVGGASNFNLVPITNSGDPTALDGTGEVVNVSNDTVTVAFIDDRAEPEGPFDGSIIARGFVDAGTVQPQSVSGDTNPLEAEPVNNNGNSESPDIVSIERDVSNNSLIVEFDEPVNSSDTSGFNYYTQNGAEISAVENVTRVDETTLGVRFTLANPVADAVGGSAESNAVVGEGPGEDANLPDEELITGESGTPASSAESIPLAAGGIGVAGLAGMMLFVRRQHR